MATSPTFTITELRRTGGVSVGAAGATVGEVFRWTGVAEDGTAQDSLEGTDQRPRGGTRAIPRGERTIGGKQRTVRTDYPGAKVPSEQVLGPVLKPQRYSGVWDDRWNYPGYALEEAQRFEAMCERGSLVRITMGSRSFEGIIDDWDVVDRVEWQMAYSFQVSVHAKVDSPNDANRVDSTAVERPAQLLDDVDFATQAMLDSHREAPTGNLVDATGDETEAAVMQMARSRDALAASFDVNDLRPNLEPIATTRSVATRFRMAQGDAFELINIMAEYRSDTQLTARTAMAVLNFECWSRSMRYQARLVMYNSRQGALACDDRADAPAARMYRPRAGESLYAISRRFFGTPWAWRAIADRNSLRTLTMTGEELLIIPEGG